MNTAIHRFLPWLMLGLLVIVFAWIIAPRIVINQTIEGSNEIEHLQNVQRTERLWPGGIRFLFDLKQITDPGTFIPESTFPLILVRISYLAFGRNIVSVRMISMVAYLLTLIVLFLFGKRLSNPWGGLMAACIFACSPFAFNEAHFFSLYALGGLMATLTLFLLVKTDHFQSIPWSILFGIALGWTLMTEQAAPMIVLSAPVAIVSFQSLFWMKDQSKQEKTRTIILLSVAAVLTLLISGQYLVDYVRFFAESKHTAIYQPPHGYDEAPQLYRGGIPYSPYYLTEGPKKIIGLPVTALLLLLSTVLLFSRKAGRKIGAVLVFVALSTASLGLDSWYLCLGAAVIAAAFLLESIEYNRMIAAWLFAPLVIFSLFATKAPQYMFEAIPAVALIASLMTNAASRQKILKWIFLPLVFASIMISFHQITLASLNEIQFEKISPLLEKRLFNMNFIHHPKQSRFAAAAEKTASWIPPGTTGLVVYLPGSSPVDRTKLGHSSTQPDLWFQEFQIWLDYERPGLDHLTLSRDHLAGLDWPEPDVDYLIWMPMDRNQLAQLWDELDMEPAENVKAFFREGPPGNNFVEATPELPGTPLGQYEFIPGRTAIVGKLENDL